jgi:hypothetical protein
MQFTLNKSFKLFLTSAVLLTATFGHVSAADSKSTFTEDQFLNSFSGKSKTIIKQKLGAPARKELSVKPEGAAGFLGKVGADEKNSKRVNVEMWYYKNLVKYDPKHTYKETEITFVNDKVMNIAFFNNK